MLNKFYDNPMAEPDLSCVDEMEEPQMWAPFYTTLIAPKLITLAMEDKKALALPGLWLGLPVLILLIAFLNLTFAPFVRRMDGRGATDTSGARLFVWLAATASLLTLCLFGAAFAATAEAGEMLMLFGLAPLAKYAAWSGVIAGILGLIALIKTLRAHLDALLAFGTLIGFSLTGIAAVALSLFLLSWGLGPF